MKTAYQPRLLALQRAQAPELMKQLGLTNIQQLPKLEKIVLNVGLGKARDDKRLMETAQNTLLKITAQKPVITRAKAPIANFRLREGQPIGVMVTLRDQRMYEFLDRLISLVLPRLRDFRGLPISSLDQSGNYCLGFKDQSVFNELSYEETVPAHGLQVNLTIAAANPAQAQALLRCLGWPLRKETK